MSNESPLKKIEERIKADVAEAKGLEPLVDDAKAVPKQVRSRLKKALPLIGLVGLGVLLISTGLYDQLKLDKLAERYVDMQAWTDQHPLLAALALVGAIATIISTGLPGGAALVVFGGLLLGWKETVVLAAIGDCIGASVLYFAARNLFMGDDAKPPALVEKIRAGFSASPVSFAFFLRLVPVFPFGAISVALAWLGCSYRLFLAASFLGVLPSSAVYAALGEGLAKTLAAHEPIHLDILAQPRFAIPLVGLAVLALLPALFGLKRKR